MQGNILKGLFFLIAVPTCYFFAVLLFPAVIGGLLHLWSILDAALFKK